MIEENTVLVLGAGASLPYGFPSGPALIQQIIGELSSLNSDLRVALARCNVNDDYITQFRMQLQGADSRSIDSFISKDLQRSVVGKICIAYLLMKAESDSVSSSEGRMLAAKSIGGAKPDHWYAILKQALETASPEKLRENRLAVITFNYDRSLEYYLHYSLLADYGRKANADIILALKAIRFVHVYGKLGSMPWDEDGDGLEYGRINLRGHDMMKMTQRLTVMSESAAENNFKQARETLGDADKIVFLGFGYHDVNLQALQLATMLTKGRAVTGTRKGLTQLQVHRLRKHYPMLGRLMHVDESYSSSELLRHEILLDGEMIGAQIPDMRTMS